MWVCPSRLRVARGAGAAVNAPPGKGPARLKGGRGRCSREGKHRSNLECGGNGAVPGAWPGKVALESKGRRPAMPTHTRTRSQSLELHRGKASTPALGGSHTHSQSTPPARLPPPSFPQLVSPKRITEFLLLRLPSLAPLSSLPPRPHPCTHTASSPLPWPSLLRGDPEREL